MEGLIRECAAPHHSFSIHSLYWKKVVRGSSSKLGKSRQIRTFRFPMRRDEHELRVGASGSGQRRSVQTLVTRKTSMREIDLTVPQTDTGTLVEYTKVDE